jgi:hypothetical protein
LRSRGNTIRSLTEKHFVEEQGENLFFGKFLLDLVGEEGFPELARKQLFASQEVVTRELLRERTTSAADFARPDNSHTCSKDALVIDARMRKKAAILRGDKRINDVRRQVVESNEDPATLTDFGNQAPVAAEDPQGDLQRNPANRLCRWQAGSHKVISAENGSRGSHACRQTQSCEQYEPLRISALSPAIGFFVLRA